MKLFFLLAPLLLISCSNKEVYDATISAREDSCEQQYNFSDPLYDDCMRAAQRSFEDSQRLQPQQDN